MKKILLTFILLLFPLTVFASNTLSIDTKTYNKETKELVVGGTSSTSYNQIQVSIFNGEKMVAFKTASVINGKYETKFIITFDENTTLKIKTADENSTETEETTLLIPKVILPNTLQDENNNSITDMNSNFTGTKKLVIKDLKNDITDEILKKIKSQLNKNETFITAYDISVYEGTTITPLSNGKYKIKLKMTDEMKKFDSLKAVYITDDNDEIKLKEYFDVTINGDYLIFTTTHLSIYGIIGINNTAQDSIVKTGDNVLLIFGTLLVFAIVSYIVALKLRKHKNK